MTIEEAISNIDRLPEGIRPKIASLVWWDYFSQGKTVDPYFREWMDKYKKEEEGYNDAEVCKALMAVGYSEKRAKKRAKTPELNHK